MEKYWIALTVSSIGLIGGLIYWGLKSYMSKKFENMATLRDIGKITEAVESVKKVFQDDTEKLKSQLSVLTNKHNVLFEEEKEALYIYFSAWNVWFGNLKIMFSNYGPYNYNDLDALWRKCNDEYDKVKVSMSKLELFLNNDNILKSVYQLNHKTYALQNTNEKFIKAIYWNYSEIDYRCKGLNEAQIIKDPRIQKCKGDIESNSIQYNEIIEGYYTDIYLAQTDFTLLSREYIRRDIK